MRASVFGLGKLGAPWAAVLAARGHEVIGYDTNARAVTLLVAGTAPVPEPRLQEMIDAGRANLRGAASVEVAVSESDCSFVIVPTPSDADGRFSPQFVVTCCEGIGGVLKRLDRYHVVVVMSTLMPGDMARQIIPALERSSGRRCGPDFGVCYNPEFIAIGRVVEDMLRPDLVLIGEYDKTAGDVVAALYERTCLNAPRIVRMGLVSAELAKISVNAYVTMKISFANQLAEICETLPGADVDAVTDALGCDSRIGRKYLRAGLGFGGPCFPRDNRAFQVVAGQVTAPLAAATDTVNDRQVERLVECVRRLRGDSSGHVAVLGVSYRPGTGLTECSQALAIARALADLAIPVVLHDPLALPGLRRELTGTLRGEDDLARAVQGAAVIALTTPWPHYEQLADQLSAAASVTVLDCWGLLRAQLLPPTVRYVRLGSCL